MDLNFPGARCYGTRFFRGSGTSQAAAFVSGAAALLISQRPSIKPDQVKALLKKTARPLKGADPTAQGAGLINLKAARDTQDALDQPELDAQQRNWLARRGPGLCPPRLGRGRAAGRAGHLRHAVLLVHLGLCRRAETAWSGGDWMGKPWTGGGFTGASWASPTWASAPWTRSSWRGDAWTSDSWARSSWRDGSWSGDGWARSSWRMQGWSGNVWSSVGWD